VGQVADLPHFWQVSDLPHNRKQRGAKRGLIVAYVSTTKAYPMCPSHSNLHMLICAACTDFTGSAARAVHFLAYFTNLAKACLIPSKVELG
jgi:hypothetical protein